MFDSENTTSFSPAQPAITKRTNREISQFPAQAKVVNANIVFFDNGCNSFEDRTVRDGEVVTLTGRAGLSLYTFQAGNVSGYVFARGVEVAE